MTSGALHDVLFWLFVLCLGYLLLVNALYLALFVVAVVEEFAGKRQRLSDDYETLAASRFTIPVSVVAPVYNEEPVIVASIRSLLALDYPLYEVIVVNDGSTDGTLDRLRSEFGLEPRQVFYRRRFATEEIRAVYRSETEPRLIVVDKANGGKADSLNAGLNLARYRYVCCVDGDSVFDRTALLEGMRPVVKDPAMVIGVTSHVAITRHPELRAELPPGEERLDRHLLSNFQLLDYLRAYFNNRLAWSRLDFMLCAAGAFSIWRRDVLEEVGGFSREYTCEDIEMSFRVHERYLREGRPYKILSLPATVASTEGPDRIRSLISQRARWQRVIMETVWANRGMLGRPRYRTVGLIGVPFYVLSEVAAPVFELMSIALVPLALGLGVFDWKLFLLFTGTIVFLNAIITSSALLLQDASSRSYPLRDLVRLILLGPAELLVYRPLLIVARLQGAWGFLRGDKSWHKFERNARLEIASPPLERA